MALVHGGVGRCGDNRFPGIYLRVDSQSVLQFVREQIDALEAGAATGGPSPGASASIQGGVGNPVSVSVPSGFEEEALAWAASTGNVSVARAVVSQHPGLRVDVHGGTDIQTPLFSAAAG